jgi:hypothetical protein
MEVARSSRRRRLGREAAAGAGAADRAPEPLAAQLRSLQAAAASIGHLRDLEKLADVAHAAARDGLDSGLLVLAVVDDYGPHLRAGETGGLASGKAKRLATIRLDEPIPLARLARVRGPVLFQSDPGALLDPGAAPRSRQSERSLAAVALGSHRQSLGLMVVERPRHRPFCDDDRPFLNVLAGLCGLAMERLRLSIERSHDRAILRRRVALRAGGTQLAIGRLRIDLERFEVDVDGRSASLTPSEFRVLMFLAEQPGCARTRQEILQHLWQTEHVRGERACDAHICNLRRKLERDPSRPELVVTRRGVGYALQAA